VIIATGIPRRSSRAVHAAGDDRADDPARERGSGDDGDLGAAAGAGQLEGEVLPVARIASVDLMARRRLMDDMPSIMLRATIRSTVTATLQYQAQRAGEREQTLAMALAAGVITAGSILLASADDRTWRALPADVSIARARLPRGKRTITLETAEGPRSAAVELSGRYAVVDLRLLRHHLFANAPRARAGR
jgi:hypothetical protein